MDVEVLIIGAGPTGLMLANQLARRGVRPLIIDRHSGPAQQTRAMTVQARTLEIYSKMGLTEQAHALGAIADGANMWANGKWTARIPIGDIGKSMSSFQYILMLGQDDNERIMGEQLHELGVDIQWNTEFIALEQYPDYVDVTLRQLDGSTRRLRAAWVAGCDGSHSLVREKSGITFSGAPDEHVFFVADTQAMGTMKPGELNVYLWADGFHLFFPMKGKDRWRVIGILPKALRQRDNVTFDEVVPAIQQEAGTDLIFKQCSWFSTYRISHRIAERFRDRRCFLLGDAAHIHSPAGAQGMNTGLQDAYNLAWKLALVMKRDAHVSLLDTYEQERIPMARRLLKTTDKMFQIIVADGWLGQLFCTRILARMVAFAMTKEQVRKLAFRTISQIGIRYRESALSKNLPDLPEDAPRAGDRFPWMKLSFHPSGPIEDLFARLDDTHFNLLVFGQVATITLKMGDIVRVHTVSESSANESEQKRVGITGCAFYLLRPDGHVGLAGKEIDVAAIESYFNTIGYSISF